MRRRASLPGEKYESEAALCAFFAERARAGGWQVHPECAGFDLLCVAGENVVGGFHVGDQIGVEAKLRPNLTVLSQLLDHKRARGPRPNYFLALVPSAPLEFRELAKELLFSVLTGVELQRRAADAVPFERGRFVKHLSTELCWVPECEVEGMCGGKSAPQKLTEWKLKAVKLCIHGLEQGYLTSADFLAHGVSIARWVKLGWIAPLDFAVNERKRRVRRYMLVPEKKPPHLQYPEVLSALAKAGAL